MTGEKEANDVMQGEAIRRVIEDALCEPDPVRFAAANIEALFAPILAEKEREKAIAIEEAIENAGREALWRDQLRKEEARALAAEADRDTFKLALIMEKERADMAVGQMIRQNDRISYWQDVAEAAGGKILAAEAALTEIARQDEIEIALDPDWPRRIASAALAQIAAPGAAMEAP